MKINPERQINPTEAIVESVAENYALESVSWESVEQGIGNVVVRLSTSQGIYFAKFYNLDHSPRRTLDEIRLVEQLGRTGKVPTPKFVETADRSGTIVTEAEGTNGWHQVILSEGISGSHPTLYNQSTITAIATAHANMHLAAPVDSSSQPLDVRADYHFASGQKLQQYEQVDNAIDQVLNKIMQDWVNYPSGLVHLDVVANNILFNEGKLSGIIDFEDTCSAPYSFCLAGTLWDVLESTESTELSDLYLNTYEEIRPLRSIERKVLHDMMLVRGWLALHGSLLTSGDNKTAARQASLLKRLL